MPQIISIKELKNTSKIFDLCRDLEMSEKQIAEGSVKDAKTALAMLRNKYDL